MKPEESILIDNEQLNLDAWAVKGGQTCLFTTEAQFLADLNDQLAEINSV